MKVLLSDVCEYVNNHWPAGDYAMEEKGPIWESEAILCEDDGTYNPRDPMQVVDLEDCDFYFVWQGKADEETFSAPSTLAQGFRKWRKSQTYETFVVEVPKAKARDFQEILKKLRGKVVK